MPRFTIAFYNLYEELNKDNRLFELRDATIGDDLLLPFGELRRNAEKQNIDVATIPALPIDAIDAYVFIDMPDTSNHAFRQAVATGRPLYLMVLESRLVRPQNYDLADLKFFRKIFTYDDSVVDSVRFIKLNYAFQIPTNIPQRIDHKEKLCVMIAGFKYSQHPDELYGERLTAIRWYEQFHPEDFDLFGVGWNKGRLGKYLPKGVVRHCRWLENLGAPRRPSYRGAVKRKRDVMGRYRFAFCYENIKDVPGYITEKIFDAFFAGTVPIYRGADNVTDYIPSDCFIDLRQFPDYTALHEYIKCMSDRSYQSILQNIERFLNSEQALRFSSNHFSDTLLSEIIHG